MKPNAYKDRSLRVKAKFGTDAYKVWGKMGGNPVLMKGKSHE